MAAERGKPKTKAQHKKLAELLSQGDIPVSQALLAAGYTETQAKKGMAAVPDAVLKMLPKKAKRLMNLGKADKQSRTDLIRGRLMDNVLTGKDGGAMSAKILGQDRELNLWQPDSMTGLIVLEAPKALLERKQEILDAEY
jgi:hypothetical protein